MGYLRNKYTKDYFLNYNESGNPTDYGAVGVEDFLLGRLRNHDLRILNKVKFNNRKVLDLGFGRGEAIKYAFEKRAKKIVGVDFSKPAWDIARRYLTNYGIFAELYCSDITSFLNKNNSKFKKDKFDLILLLDVVEHIPRIELKKTLQMLKEIISKKGIIVINTPVFTVDSDGFRFGINPRSFEDSDEHEETRGMHINRYTKKSLVKFMSSCGFQSISCHYFVLRSHCYLGKGNNILTKILACINGYGFTLPTILSKENYEYAISRSKETQVKDTIYRKCYLYLRHKMKIILINFKLYKDLKNIPKPQEFIVLTGPLMGKKLWFDLNKATYWKEMVLGVYDNFIYQWINNNININNKIVWDIGAHFGYHTMSFAALVGEKGRVIAIEPNRSNVIRLKKNIKINKEISKRILINQIAVSNRKGKTDFIFTDEVDDSRSMGSHLGGIQAPEKDIMYKGFKHKIVQTDSIDNLVNKIRLPVPDVIKIDVEGAESLVINGATNLLNKHRPTLFIEVHSVTQMYRIQEMLYGIGYTIELISDAGGSRSRNFIVASYLKK